jgi:hypothetical protein
MPLWVDRITQSSPEQRTTRPVNNANNHTIQAGKRQYISVKIMASSSGSDTPPHGLDEPESSLSRLGQPRNYTGRVIAAMSRPETGATRRESEESPVRPRLPCPFGNSSDGPEEHGTADQSPDGSVPSLSCLALSRSAIHSASHACSCLLSSLPSSRSGLLSQVRRRDSRCRHSAIWPW